jgi:hypothetical protein
MEGEIAREFANANDVKEYNFVDRVWHWPDESSDESFSSLDSWKLARTRKFNKTKVTILYSF